MAVDEIRSIMRRSLNIIPGQATISPTGLRTVIRTTTILLHLNGNHHHLVLAGLHAVHPHLLQIRITINISLTLTEEDKDHQAITNSNKGSLGTAKDIEMIAEAETVTEAEIVTEADDIKAGERYLCLDPGDGIYPGTWNIALYYNM
jgi:hypothetical protein